MRFIRRTQKRKPTAIIAITEKKEDRTTAVKPPLLSSPMCGEGVARAAKSMIDVVRSLLPLSQCSGRPLVKESSEFLTPAS